MFEGPDWAFDDRTAVQRARDASADLVRWARDERESSRVTVRRVHLGTGGRDAVAIDARRLMPLAVRAAIDGGGRQQGSVRIGTTGRDPDVASWFARLRAPA